MATKKGNFSYDLKRGKLAESAFANALTVYHLVKGYPEIVKVEYNNSKSYEILKKYDIIFTFEGGITKKAEIKYDTMCSKTGNIVIEYLSKSGAASGICATDAYYTVYAIEELDKTVNYYMFQTLELRDFCMNDTTFNRKNISMHNNFSYLFRLDYLMGKVKCRVLTGTKLMGI